MFQSLNPQQLQVRHLRLSKIVLFVSTIVLVLTLTHIHHLLCKHHRFGHGRSHSHSHAVEVASSGAGAPSEADALHRFAKKLDDDDDDEVPRPDDEDSFGTDDENIDIVEQPRTDVKKKSLSNSHSLSHVMKKHFRKHFTAPTCAATISTLLVAIIGVAAGFSGRSCSARALMAAIAVSAVIHAVGIAQRSAKICHNPESADMCAHIHKLVGVMILGSLLHHFILLFVAARYFILCRFIESQNAYVPIAGVVCVDQPMEEKQVA